MESEISLCMLNRSLHRNRSSSWGPWARRSSARQERLADARYAGLSAALRAMLLHSDTLSGLLPRCMAIKSAVPIRRLRCLSCASKSKFRQCNASWFAERYSIVGRSVSFTWLTSRAGSSRWQSICSQCLTPQGQTLRSVERRFG